VPTSTIAYRFAGATIAEPGADDGRSVLGFQSRPDLDRVLAATSFLYDVTTGEVLESDIFFNSAFPWSVAAEGEANRYDLESIALHELGHFSGLGHSAIGETEQLAGGRRVTGTAAVMFPIAFSAGSTAARVLRPDDVAGISDLYPETGFRDDHGTLSGHITKNGRGVLGAHAVAFRVATGELVGGFSLSDDGTFSIAGLTPGPYVLRVEPLDDADVESFFDVDIDLNFRGVYAKRLAVVPHGGDSGAVDVVVVSK
jgi:hypothetical protein